MLVQIQKWGNSLAIRIPKSFAKEIPIDQDSLVDLSPVDGKLVAIPIAIPIIETEYSLEALLAEVTEENIHTEIDTGESVGNEVRWE